MPTALVVAGVVLQAMGALVPDKTIAEGSSSNSRSRHVTQPVS